MGPKLSATCQKLEMEMVLTPHREGSDSFLKPPNQSKKFSAASQRVLGAKQSMVHPTPTTGPPQPSAVGSSGYHTLIKTGTIRMAEGTWRGSSLKRNP